MRKERHVCSRENDCYLLIMTMLCLFTVVLPVRAVAPPAFDLPALLRGCCAQVPLLEQPSDRVVRSRERASHCLNITERKNARERKKDEYFVPSLADVRSLFLPFSASLSPLSLLIINLN